MVRVSRQKESAEVMEMTTLIKVVNMDSLSEVLIRKTTLDLVASTVSR